MALPPLVLLPGLDGTGDNFAPLLDAMPPAHPRVVVRYPPHRALTLHEQVDLVREATHGLEQYLVVAESFSGPTGIAFAGEAPEGCRGLVLVATFRRLPLPLPSWLLRLAAPLFAAVTPPHLFVRATLAGMDASAALLQSFRRSFTSNSATAIAGRLRLLAEVDVGDAFLRIDVPVLYLQAQHDHCVPAHNLRDLRRLREDLTVARLDSPHLVLQRAPLESLQEIERWWSRLSGADPLAG